MGTYQKPGSFAADYSAIGKGIADSAKNFAAGKSQQAKAALAAAKAGQKQNLKKNKAINSIYADISSSAKFNNTQVQAKYKSLLDRQLDILSTLPFDSDDWNTQTKAITDMVQSSKLGIELVNQEKNDLDEVYTFDNATQTYKPMTGNIAGGPLATNDKDKVDLVKDYGRGGAGIDFFGGSEIVNGKLVVNTNVGMKWTEQGTAQGVTPRTTDLSFNNYTDAKAKGYDIIGRTNGEAFDVTMNLNKDLYFGQDYKDNFEETVTTTIQLNNGEYTEEVIKSYEESQKAQKEKFDAAIPKLNFNQSDWQMVQGNPNRVIDPTNPQDRKDYADLLWKNLEDRYAIKDRSKFDVKKLEKSDAFAMKINDIRGRGIGGFETAWQTEAFKDFDARGLDPSTGSPWAQGVTNKVGLTSRKNLTPKVLKNVSIDLNKKIKNGPSGVTQLAEVLTAINPSSRHSFKSGAQARQEVVDAYKDDYLTQTGSAGNPIQVLKFAAGKAAVQPSPDMGVYYGADKIVPGKLFDMSGNSARSLKIDNDAQIYDIILDEIGLSKNVKDYIISGAAVKQRNLPTEGTVTKSKTK